MNEDAKARGDWAIVIAGLKQEKKPLKEATLLKIAGLQARLGQSLLKDKQYAETEPILRECLATRELLIPDEWLRFNAMSLLGGSLLGQGKYAEAEPLLLQGYAGMWERETKIPELGKHNLPEAVERLVHLYEATDQPQKAAEWRAKLPPAVAPPPRPRP